FMDGIALARLHERVLNAGRDHDPDKPLPPAESVPPLSTLDVARRELARQAQDSPRAAARLAGAVVRGARSPGAALRYARSLGRVASPPPPNRSKVLRGGRQRMWRFGTLECE